MREISEMKMMAPTMKRMRKSNLMTKKTMKTMTRRTKAVILN
jgi:hypothetical protein